VTIHHFQKPQFSTGIILKKLAIDCKFGTDTVWDGILKLQNAELLFGFCQPVARQQQQTEQAARKPYRAKQRKKDIKRKQVPDQEYLKN